MRTVFSAILIVCTAINFLIGQKEAQGPSMFEPDTQVYDMPENGLTAQYPKIELSARTETLIASSKQNVIPVMVMFDVSNAGNPDAVAQAVAQGQQALLATLNRETNAVVQRTYKYSPYVSALVTVSDIKVIANLSEVVRVVENTFSYPTLHETLKQVNVTQLLSDGQNGSGAAVAVLDTGADPDHPMFDEGKIVASACFGETFTVPGLADVMANCPDGTDEQISLSDGSAGETCNPFFFLYPEGLFDCFHGNHVAGIAAGGAWDLSGGSVDAEIQGVAKGADIVALNVFSTVSFVRGPTRALSFLSDQMAALEWIYDNYETYNIAAANMSLGGGQSFAHCDYDPRFTIIDMLRTAGVATVIASGNDGYEDSVGFPACISAAVTVGSVSKAGVPSDFSNYGPGLVDLVAPGEAVVSAFGYDDVTGYAYYFPAYGTSMATPHVAGAFTLLKARFPDASVDDIESVLQATGVPTADGQMIDIAAAYEVMFNSRIVPTMGEWAVLNLGLILMIFGVVVVRNRSVSYS